MTYTVTIDKPSGATREAEARDKREIGQVVAFALYYGAGISRKEATQLGIAAERDHHLSAHGYTFTVTKEGR